MALFSFFKNLFKKESKELPITIDPEVVKKNEFQKVMETLSGPVTVEPVKEEEVKVEKKKKTAQPKAPKTTATKAKKQVTKKEKK
jgi:hypothetical protein